MLARSADRNAMHTRRDHDHVSVKRRGVDHQELNRRDEQQQGEVAQCSSALLVPRCCRLHL
jgi:hypothetical protein